MAKKNRKKELKHQNKVIPFRQAKPYEDVSLFDDWDDSDWEDIPFSSDIDDEDMEDFELLGNMVDQFINQFGKDEAERLIAQEGFEPADLEFLRVMGESNHLIRAKKLADLAKQYPNHFQIVFESLVSRNELFEDQYFYDIQAFYKMTMESWKGTGYADTRNQKADMYLEGLRFISNYYLMIGNYRQALSIIDLVLSKVGMRYPENFETIVLATYLANFERDKIYDFIGKLRGKIKWASVYLVLADLMAGELVSARKHFDSLAKAYRPALHFFLEPTWIEIFETGELQSDYPLDGIEDMLDALYHVYPLLSSRPFLQIQLTAFADDYMEQFEPKKISPVLTRQLDNLANFYGFKSAPELEGIKIQYIRNLYHDGGIKKVADFKKKTEAQILAIPGIGPGTIKKLKANGVRFKGQK